MSLLEAIAVVTKAPIDAVYIHTNPPLYGRVVFEKKADNDPFLYLF